jgi:hypothetical protein
MSLSEEELESLTENPLFKFVKKEDLETVSNALDEAVVSVDDHCIDNFRVFPEIMSFNYNEVAEDGCCGSYDNEVVAPSGVKYLIGFNYGH